MSRTGSTTPPAARGGTSIAAAVLFATAPAGDGGPAALLPWHGGTVLGRLVGQLAALGVQRTVVVTRPAWDPDVRAALGAAAEVLTSPDVPSDLGLLADLADGVGDGGLVAAYGDIVTHDAALAGVLADPRVATGVLAGGRYRTMVFRIRNRRGRLISAASAYHAVYRPTGTELSPTATARVAR